MTILYLPLLVDSASRSRFQTLCYQRQRVTDFYHTGKLLNFTQNKHCIAFIIV
jgi:hypothetical protein